MNNQKTLNKAGSNKKPHIDVCICTYKRPQLLARLLDSVLRQDTHGLFYFSIVVVDNDAGASAEPVVRARMNRDHSVTYDIEPDQNISLARNRALRHATGEFAAVIDDDEEAGPQWLFHLCNAMLHHRADVVFGPVVRYFEHDPPAYVVQSRAFLLPDPPTGSQEGFTWAGNALIRRSVLASTPYDPAFGRTGGGDSNLYVGLRRRGHKLIWCSEARVREHIPPERANWRWILRRDFRVGNNTDRIHCRPSPPIHDLLGNFFSSAVHMFQSLLRIAFLKDRQDPPIKHMRRCAWALGRIAHRFDFHYEEYTGQWSRAGRIAKLSRVEPAAE